MVHLKFNQKSQENYEFPWNLEIKSGQKIDKLKEKKKRREKNKINGLLNIKLNVYKVRIEVAFTLNRCYFDP